MKWSSLLCKEGYLLNKKKQDKHLINSIKKELTVKPFSLFSIGASKIESFKIYQENDNILCIPKYYGLTKLGKPNKVDELLGESNKLKFKGYLRDYQKEIVGISIKHMDQKDGGLISIGCGRGKTVIALYLACYYKVKTLVIVHKTFLLNQWKERASQFTNAKIGIIQQKKIEVDGNEIVIGMLQSIAKEKYDSDIFRDFGLVIFDEAHHAPSKYFSKALPIIASKKTLALSATPKRTDKLEKVLFWYFGDIIYKEPPTQNTNVLVKIIKYDIKHPYFKEFTLPYNNDINRPKTINNIIEIKKRNKFIIKMLKEILIEDGRKILILSDRIRHLELLKEIIDKKLATTVDYYIGGMSQKKLNISAKSQVLLASYGMASEALDIPELNTLIMVTPRRSIEQSIGRIIRKKTNKIQPLVIDMVDQLPCFVKQGLHRRKFYQKLNYQIKLVEVENNKIMSEENITEKNKLKYITISNDDVEFIL